jgi:hypothetical protein
MLIHETAAVTGLTIDAIRYYERQHLLGEVADPDGEDAQVGHARLLGMDAFHPDPGDPFALAIVVHGKRDAIIVHGCLWE